MLKTVVKKGSYHDSVVLMLLTNKISAIEGVKKVSIMMATPANKDIFKQSGLDTEELMAASANDMVVVADIDDDALLDTIMEQTEEFFRQQSAKSGEKKGAESVKSWDKALQKLPDANLAVISIPGAYAALEADRALDEGMNVFMFSDNVTLEDEVKLKQKAHEKGLAVMGPDCGTGIIQSVPIAFTNNVARGVGDRNPGTDNDHRPSGRGCDKCHWYRRKRLERRGRWDYHDGHDRRYGGRRCSESGHHRFQATGKRST